jgi:hypothetical protein
MKLKEMKQKTFALIEELYPELSNLAEDEDVINKINGVVNAVQMDLMKFRKITANEEIEIELDDDRIIDLKDYDDIYQVNKIKLIPNEDDMVTTFNMIDNTTLEVDNSFAGTIKIYYYKYPTLCKTMFNNDTERQNEDNRYVFEIDPMLLEIMPYGIARDLLRLDMISNYGSYFERTYNDLIQRLDSRNTAGFITIEGGIDL